jgi:hypothetical protein
MTREGKGFIVDQMKELGGFRCVTRSYSALGRECVKGLSENMRSGITDMTVLGNEVQRSDHVHTHKVYPSPRSD